MKHKLALFTMCVLLSGASFSCSKDEPSATTSPEEKTTASLNFYEQQLVGTWYKYYSSDGHEEYYCFNSDRTACYWEETSSSYQRFKQKTYPKWSITDQKTVTVEGLGLSRGLTFDYPAMKLWPTGYTELVYTKSGSGKTCQ
ncbi:MAG: hypothetical protein AB1728_01060 [Bacteroidota bacterium]